MFKKFKKWYLKNQREVLEAVVADATAVITTAIMFTIMIIILLIKECTSL